MRVKAAVGSWARVGLQCGIDQRTSQGLPAWAVVDEVLVAVMTVDDRQLMPYRWPLWESGRNCVRVLSALITSGLIGITNAACIEYFAEAPNLGAFSEPDSTRADAEGSVDGGRITGDTGMTGDGITFDQTTVRSVAVGGTANYTITGLTDGQAYRLTLVVRANIDAPGDGTGTFIDDDMNGAADAGASENTALITVVNGAMVDGGGAKTVPGGMDDPAAPSGIFPTNGAITVTVTGVGPGTVFPVAYVNGGSSTFLELGADGAPTENYAVGGALEVMTGGSITIEPTDETMIEVGGDVEYAIGGLDDAQAYRITLVVGGNITAPGNGTGVFVDGDMNSASDAGASERVALITSVNDAMLSDGGAKTVPGGMDDPAMPSGVFPQDGEITTVVTGVATGTVYPVAYENGGNSTFLELGGDLAPVETYIVGGAVTVRGPTPTVEPAGPQMLGVGTTLDYTISGLNDAQAYRIALVVAANLTDVGDGTATFVDGDRNGAADAGPSENVALITVVNGTAVDRGGAKTVPGGMDDPAMPSGVNPVDGSITLTLTGQGVGTIHPVVYENGGMSTFLEIGGDGVPMEVYTVGGPVTVQ